MGADGAQSEKPQPSPGPRSRRGSTAASRRNWRFRLAAMLFPLLALGVLEISFRVAGTHKDENWANPYG